VFKENGHNSHLYSLKCRGSARKERQTLSYVEELESQFEIASQDWCTPRDLLTPQPNLDDIDFLPLPRK
jgi:hypothetical protein